MTLLGSWGNATPRLPLMAFIGLLALLTACASGRDKQASEASCRSCSVAFSLCDEDDNHNNCLNMLNYCTGVCRKGTTCEDGCMSARAGCLATSLDTEVCDEIADRCVAACSGVVGSPVEVDDMSVIAPDPEPEPAPAPAPAPVPVDDAEVTPKSDPPW